MRRLALVLAIGFTVLSTGMLCAQRNGAGTSGQVPASRPGVGATTAVTRTFAPAAPSASHPAQSLTPPLNRPQNGRPPTIFPDRGSSSHWPNTGGPHHGDPQHGNPQHGGPGQGDSAHGDSGHGNHHHGDRQQGLTPYSSPYGDLLVPNLVGYPIGWTLDLNNGSDDNAELDEQQDQSTQQQSPGAAPEPAPEEYAAQPPPQEADAAGSEVPVNTHAAEPESKPEIAYRPPYLGALGSEQARAQPTTTVIFNDGRASEEVHNYILTRSALFDLDGGLRREIPLAEIDVPATIRANHSAGVDFSLPAAR